MVIFDEAKSKVKGHKPSNITNITKITKITKFVFILLNESVLLFHNQ